jgi:hypothetical protein
MRGARQSRRGTDEGVADEEPVLERVRAQRSCALPRSEQQKWRYRRPQAFFV